MLKRLFTYSLAIPLVGIVFSGCGDDGGGTTSQPDAAQRPDANGGGTPDANGGGTPDANGGGTPDASGAPDAGGPIGVTTSVAGGRLAALPGYQNIVGGALLVRSADGIRADLAVEGLTASTEYIASVYRLPCAVDQAGDHYKHDPTIAEELEANEIWLRVTTDAAGKGVATTEQPGLFARMDAQAIVIHDPAAAGAKMACADLRFADGANPTIAFQSSFEVLAGAPAADANIAGTADVTVTATETRMTLAVTGLDAAATYIAHVHELPCAVNQAGGHYKIDPTIAEELEANEIWPSLTEPAEQVFAHALRYDGQSIVIHRVEPNTPAVACVDLVRQTAVPDFVTRGTAGRLGGVDNVYRNINSTATLTRKSDGSTELTLTGTGYPKGALGFVADIHASTCSQVPVGGPHYKIDPTIVEDLTSNQLRLTFNSLTDGTVNKSTIVAGHLARPDAISLVLHEPSVGTPLSCIDLQ
jgi:hypothetical protein